MVRLVLTVTGKYWATRGSGVRLGGWTTRSATTSSHGGVPRTSTLAIGIAPKSPVGLAFVEKEIVEICRACSPASLPGRGLAHYYLGEVEVTEPRVHAQMDETVGMIQVRYVSEMLVAV